MAVFQYEGLSLQDAQVESARLQQEQAASKDAATANEFQYDGVSVSTAKQEHASNTLIEGMEPEQLPPHLKKLFGISEGIISEETKDRAAAEDVPGEVVLGSEQESGFLGGTKAHETKDLKDIPEDIDPTVYSTARELTSFEKRQIRPGKMKHQVKLMGETVLMSTAEFTDFLANPPNAFTAVAPDTWTEEVSINGTSLSDLVSGPGSSVTDKSHTQMTKDALLSVYTAAGVEPTLEEARDIEDIAVIVAGSNLTATGLVSGVRKGVAGIAGYADELTDFLRTEMKFNLWGTTTATATAVATPGTIDEKLAMAHVGNLVGMGAKAVKDVMPFSIAKDSYKSYQKAKNLTESPEVYGMAKEIVHNHLASMLPTEIIPEVEKRWELVQRIQRRYPNFNPSVGNVVGTEDFKMAQRITDSKNPAIASERYAKNKQTVEQMVKDLSEETDPTQRQQIASALKMFSDDTYLHVERLRENIINLEDNLRRINGGDVTGVEAGKSIREQVTSLKEEYKSTVKDMYDKIDPDNTSRFDVRSLLREFKSYTETFNPDRVVSDQDRGFSLLNTALPRYIKETASRVGKPQSEVIDLSAVSPVTRGTVEETPYLTFNELRKVRTMLQGQAAKIGRADPSSNAPAVIGDMVKHIDEVINTKMMSGPEDVSKRFAKAREFASEEAFPRYKEGVGGQILKEDVPTGNPIIKDDEIGPMFWQKGTKGSNLEGFNELFSKDHPELLKAIPDNATRAEAAAAASEIGKEALRSYALRTLQDSLDKAPKSSPLAVLERWEVDYKDALKAFPEIQDDVTRLRELYTNLSQEKLLRTARIEELNTNIVNRYAGVEASTVVKDILKDGASVESVDDMVRDIYKSVLREEGKVAESAAYDLLYPDTIHIDMGNPKLHAVRKALQESVAAELLRKSYDEGTGFASGTKLRGLLHKNEEKLRIIYGGEAGMQHLKDVEQALILMGQENKPLFQKDLNHIRSVMKTFGISPASILSRYYSASLGKVGPVYLVSDALTRLLTGVSDKHFDRVYKETMYNLEALNSILRRVGADDSAELVAKTQGLLKEKSIEGLKKLGRKGMGKLINDHTLLIYGRNYQPDDSDEDSYDSGQLLNEYLEMNDDYTGQPSRRMINLIDTGSDEEDDLDRVDKGELFPESTEETPIEEGADVRDAVKDVYRNLIGEEGAFGDTTGAAVTGEMGVTSGARASVKGSENMSDPEIAEAYIGQLNENIPKDVPYEVRYSLLDTSYNIGEGMFKYKGLSKALDNKDWMGVAKSLLDTASIGGESSRGIAARRARAYNRIAESEGKPTISRVLQLEDGTLTYLDDKDKTIFSYRPKGGRHETSSVGMLNVQPHEMVASADTSNGA